jgi:hypothetical protein
VTGACLGEEPHNPAREKEGNNNMGAAKIRKEKGLPPRTVKSTLPHYTEASVVALFRNNDPRITTNDYGTEKCIVLSDVEGYFKYSDKMGGIATFYRGDTEQPVFTVARVITEELRNAKCDCGDDHQWDELIYECGCTEHHEGENYYVTPRLELCNVTECDGKHAHLLGLCAECFALDELVDGKAPKDITADNIQFQIR